MKNLFCALVCALLIAPAHADVDDLLERSGTYHMVELLPAQFEQGFVQGLQQGGLDAQTADSAKGLVSRYFDVRGIKADVAQAVEQNLSAQELAQMEAWYATPLAIRVTEMENEAATAEHMERVAGSMDSLLSDESRLAQARRIEAALDATNVNLAMAYNVQIAIVNAMLSDATEQQKQTVLAQIEDAMDGARPNMEKYILGSILGTYQDLQDDELAAYVDFLEQPAARRFYTTIQDVLNSSLTQSAGELGQGLVEFFEGLRDSGSA